LVCDIWYVCFWVVTSAALGDRGGLWWLAWRAEIRWLGSMIAGWEG
jgi:hypothetical protein